MSITDVRTKVDDILEGRGSAAGLISIVLAGMSFTGVSLAILGSKIADLGSAVVNQYGFDQHNHLVTITNPTQRAHPEEYGHLSVVLRGRTNAGRTESITGKDFVPLFTNGERIVFVNDPGDGKTLTVTDVKTRQTFTVAAGELQPFVKGQMSGQRRDALGSTNEGPPQL